MSCREEVVNDGTTLYVTGLSTRVTEKELEDHFSKEGKVSVWIFCYILFHYSLSKSHTILCSVDLSYVERIEY